MNKENLTAYEVVTEENLTDIHSTGWPRGDQHQMSGLSSACKAQTPMVYE